MSAVSSPIEERSPGVSLGLALLASAAVIATGFVAPRPLPVLAWAAALVFLVVESDVRCLRIPNWLTFPALGTALALAALTQGAAGVATGLLGVAAALVLLLVPYAVGALGAGDVKAAMAFGAALGPVSTLALIVFAVAFGGLIALARVAASGEAREVFRRWFVSVGTSLATRRWVFLPAPAGSAAAGGIPFGVALGFAVAAELSWEALR